MMEDTELINRVIDLFNNGLGQRLIAKELGVNRSKIQSIYKKLNFKTEGRKNPRKPIPKQKVCKECKKEKNIDLFRKRVKGDRTSYEPYCLDCENKISKRSSKGRYIKNKQWYKDYRAKNWDEINEYNKNYNKEHAEELKAKRNTPEYREKQNLRQKRFIEKNKNNPQFCIRKAFTLYIRNCLLYNIKDEEDLCFKYLGYTVQELRDHLEKQFKLPGNEWMSWNNWGRYRIKGWNDNNSSTWKWQLDHIIPHSKFNYSSMEDEDFKKCWALSNLRPYSAKQNLLDGNRR